MKEDIINICGYHGTSKPSAEVILKRGFNPSLGNKEWLGDGVYFFVKGLSDAPCEQAKKWADAQAWNNERKVYKYDEYAVLESNISVSEDCLLDLTSAEGRKIFDFVLDQFKKKIATLSKKLKIIDGLVINLIREENIFNFEVVKGDFFIKFKEERIKQVNSRLSNCTICSVITPKLSIDSSRIYITGKVDKTV